MNNIVEIHKMNYNIRNVISTRICKRVLNFYKCISELLGLQIHVCASDNANVNSSASQVANVGGNYNNNANNTGPFYVNVNNTASNTNSNIGARCVASYPYSGQYFMSNKVLRSFTGSIITTSMNIINSMNSCRCRSQSICLILAKVNGKTLLTKERVSNLYLLLVESPLEPNRGYTNNLYNLASVHANTTRRVG